MNDDLHPDERTALRAWASRVNGDREQVERMREVDDGPDFYAPIASSFRANPFREDDVALNQLIELVEPGETWIDIGAGGGRLALPIARFASEVIAVEPSDGMLEVLRSDMLEHRIYNVRIIQSRWPLEDAPPGDVALIAHVGYDIQRIGPFLDAMERSARRLCVAVMLDTPPRALVDSLWPSVHGEPRVPLPALPEFLTLLISRERQFEVRLSPRPPMSYESRDEAIGFIRRQLWIREGSGKDQALQLVLDERLQERDGRVALSWEPGVVGTVSWQPLARAPFRR
jgi:SAM-dependent methyltransferase